MGVLNLLGLAGALLLIVALAGRGGGNRSRAATTAREAFLGFVLVIGPFVGVRYIPPKVEAAAVVTPGGQDGDGDEPHAAGQLGPPRRSRRWRRRDDGIVL